MMELLQTLKAAPGWDRKILAVALGSSAILLVIGATVELIA